MSKLFPGCEDCICRSCLWYNSGRCPHGSCYDDYRAAFEPYNWKHGGTRTAWSLCNEPGEQEHWCRGGTFYPAEGCADFVKYNGSTVKECLKANITEYQDGFQRCSLVENYGCQKCYEEFLRRYKND